MISFKSKTQKGFIALFISFVILIGMAVPSITAKIFDTASVENDDSDKIYIKVVEAYNDAESGDIKETPLKDANVGYKIINANNEMIFSDEGITDENGLVEINNSEIQNYDKDQLMLWFWVHKEGYTYLDDTEYEYDPEGDDDPKVYNMSFSQVNDGKNEFEVTMRSVNISDIIVSGKEGLIYDGTEQELISIDGLLDEDTVKYYVNGEAENNEKVKRTDAGTYRIYVIVIREGYNDFEKAVDVTIAKASIGITLNSKEGIEYNGDEQELVTLKGELNQEDEVHWYVDGTDVTDISDVYNVPKRKHCGTYKVRLTVDRKDDNYEIFEKEVTASICNIYNWINANDLIYNKEYQDALKIDKDKIPDGYTIQYKMSEDEEYKDLTDEQKPQVCDAGEYIIYICLQSNNEEDNIEESIVETTEEIENELPNEPVDDNKKEIIEFTLKVTVEKADQTLKWSNEDFSTLSEISIKELHEYEFKYDFSVTSDSEINQNIVYSTDNTDVATMSYDDTNKRYTLSVHSFDSVTIIATAEGDNNYNSATINKIITFKQDNDAQGEVPTKEYEYICGSYHNGVLIGVDSYNDIKNEKEKLNSIHKSSIIADFNDNYNYSIDIEETKKINKINDEKIKVDIEEGETKQYVKISFNEDNINEVESIEKEITINENKGTQLYYESSGEKHSFISIVTKRGLMYVNSYVYLMSIMNKCGGNYTVVLNKMKNKKPIEIYNIKIKYKDSDDDLSFEGDKGFINNIETGWYTSEVTVTPRESEKYEINTKAKPLSTSYKNNKDKNNKDENVNVNVAYPDDCNENKTVYLRNKDTNEYTKITFPLKIDKTAPEKLNITYSDPIQIFQAEEGKINFYQEYVEIYFSAEDATSDLNNFIWEYIGQDGKKQTDVITKIDEDGKATLKLPKEEADQLCGYISCTVTDNAGNTTKEYNDKNTIVVDTIPPKCNISYGSVSNTTEEGKHLYFKNNITVTLEVNESNFYEEDVELRVNETTLPKDEITWNKDISRDDYYIGTFTLKHEGNYQIKVSYTDKSGNKCIFTDDYMQNSKSDGEYKSPFITLDTKAPDLTISYSKDSYLNNNNIRYYNIDSKGEATVTFTVFEDNFLSENTVVKMIKDKNELQQIDIRWTSNANKHTGKYTISGDGSYVFSVECKDLSGNEMKESPQYSNIIVIDTKAPELSVVYDNSSDIVGSYYDYSKHSREYFKDKRTAIVTIKELNFNESNVKLNINAEDVAGHKLDTKKLVNISSWKHNGDEHTATIVYYGEANYTFDIECTDLAQNKAKAYSKDYFTIDRTPAKIINVVYSDCISTDSGVRYYPSNAIITVELEDDVSSVHSLKYGLLDDSGRVLIKEQEIKESDIMYSDNGKHATVKLTVPGSAVTSANQLKGYLKLTAYDRSNNNIEQSESTCIVIDNISPQISVEFNKPVKDEGAVAYYNGDITCTINIVEANFFAQDVNITVRKNDKKMNAFKTSWTGSGDEHTTKFTLTEDGDYEIEVEYTDRSNNKMPTYKSKKLVKDTTDVKFILYINNEEYKMSDSNVYTDEINVEYSIEDENYDRCIIVLKRIGIDGVAKQVTDYAFDENSNQGAFSIPYKANDETNEDPYDGIYIMTVTAFDKANNMKIFEYKFMVDRSGPVIRCLTKVSPYYANTDKVPEIVFYIHSVVKLDESNAIKVKKNEDLFTDKDKINKQTIEEKDKWYKYIYTLKDGYFTNDGSYKIEISPEDIKEKYKNEDIEFTVDKEKPEILYLNNLDSDIADTSEITNGVFTAQYMVRDHTSGIKSIKVMLNGTTKYVIDKLESNEEHEYMGTIEIPESNDTQSIEIIVVDKAGNEKSLSKNITVTTNLFIRWYHNSVLFYTSICAFLLLVIIIILLSGKHKKKKCLNA
ncbi:MAG: hypothetical protein ACI4II_07675 [Acutalibacteraceae bacterium]